MAKATAKKAQSRSPHTARQREILKVLENAAKKLGLKVSSGQLRFAGLKLKGGSCLLHGRKWLVLDKSQSFDDLLDIYRQAISPEEINACDLPDESKALLSTYFLNEDYSLPEKENQDRKAA